MIDFKINALLYWTVQYCTILFCTIQYCTVEPDSSYVTIFPNQKWFKINALYWTVLDYTVLDSSYVTIFPPLPKLFKIKMPYCSVLYNNVLYYTVLCSRTGFLLCTKGPSGLWRPPNSRINLLQNVHIPFQRPKEPIVWPKGPRPLQELERGLS